MIPRRLLAAAAALVLATVACSPQASSTPTGAPSGGAPSASAACATTPEPDPSSIGGWTAAQSPSIYPTLILPGSLSCGPSRFVFSFLDGNNVPVASPDRSVTVAFYDLGADPETPVTTAEATFIWAIEDTTGIYAANVDFPTAGLWGAEFVTEAPGSPSETIRVQFDLQPDATVVSVGDAAPPSDTPTLADVDGDVSLISTDERPVEAFYETSVADAVAAGTPFVLVFATPKFCATAQCGPTLERIKPIAAAHPEVTFINVEPYELEAVDGQLQPVLSGDPPALTPTAATNEWGLLGEPWVFVVDGEGIVRSSLLLIFSDEELESAIAEIEGTGS